MNVITPPTCAEVGHVFNPDEQPVQACPRCGMIVTMVAK